MLALFLAPGWMSLHLWASILPYVTPVKTGCSFPRIAMKSHIVKCLRCLWGMGRGGGDVLIDLALLTSSIPGAGVSYLGAVIKREGKINARDATKTSLLKTLNCFLISKYLVGVQGEDSLPFSIPSSFPFPTICLLQ